MNKLIGLLTMVSIFGLFNAYSSFAQASDKTTQVEKQSLKQKTGCSTLEKESCCKSEKIQPSNCCACCSGASCAAKPGMHCCG